MQRIALTGGIATGKTHVATRLRAAGVPVIDADVLAREAVVPGSPGLAAVVARFGAAMLTPEGALDRARVVGEIGAALDGRLRGRRDAQEITVFKSLGNAAQDICLAADALAVRGVAAPYFDPKGNASVE